MNKKALFIFLLMMFALSSALFAGGFALSGIGSKAIGLGGAFRGMADDPSSMYWNPAGLASMDQSSITVAGAMITPTMDFTSTGTLVPGFGLPGFQLNKKITAEKKNWMFPNLFAIHANQNPLKYGIGVYVPYGLGATWDAFSLPTAMMYNDTLRTLKWASGFPKNEMESSIGVVDIHPTIAYQVSDKVAVGAGVSVNYGMITIAKLIPDTNASYYAPTTMYLKGTGWGVGGNVGVMWKPNPILSIGFAGKLPSSVQISGDAKIRTWLNNVVVYQTMHALDPVHYPHFSDQIPGAVVGDTTDAKATMNLPGDVGLGLSLKANDRWTINGDFAYTWWTVLSEVKIKMEPAAEIHTATGTVV
ncbi:MAG TPA: outer membrane protein transport protein, partial [Candidatus Cloacimonadota bacterium]|nr:outer membrane protein transport protein [Candidatus Cloacimonadota bacterium]